MPAADLCIHDQVLPRTIPVTGISIRGDILYTNNKGEEIARVQKRSGKLLAKLLPGLQRVLAPDETVLYVARAVSPLNVLEQLTAGWWHRALAVAAIVTTNQRVLFFPVKRDGSWRESVRAAYWGDLTEVKTKGLFGKMVTFRFKSGHAVRYTNVRSADAKKIAAIAAAYIPAASGEGTAVPGMVQLCPDCRNALSAGQYLCPACGLVFKNEKTLVARSILLPGGGYFYTGHLWIGVLLAITEGGLLLKAVRLLVAGMASSKAMHEVLSALLILALFWGLETAVTILHCRRYVQDFIPAKRDPLRAARPS